LLTAKNCIITPHIAWAPKEARMRLMQIAVNNLKSFLNKQPINVVN
jgi:glycerate dehydrogenase